MRCAGRARKSHRSLGTTCLDLIFHPSFTSLATATDSLTAAAAIPVASATGAGKPLFLSRQRQGKLEPSPSGGPLFPASPSTDAISDISPDTAAAAVSKMASLSDENSAAVAAEAAAADAIAAAAAKGARGAGAASAAADADAAADRDGGDGEVDGGVGVGGGGGASVVVVGAGPAGLFAALELVEVGMKPIIVERGM